MRTRLALIAFSLLALSRCTSAPELADYPRAEIERPYTLPYHVATWKTLVPFGYYQNSTSSAFLPPIPLPVFWRSSLSDNWNLNWALLPYSASYQIKRTAQEIIGITFGTGFGYGSGNIGFVFQPHFSFFYRTRIHPTLAWEFSPGANGSVYTGGVQGSWQVELETGPLFQITPLWAARARVGVAATSGYSSGYVPSTVNVSRTARFTVPLSLSTVWSVHRQWDLSASYLFQGLGYENGYQGHTASVSATHYW